MNRRTLLAALAAVAVLGTSAQAADAPKDIVDTQRPSPMDSRSASSTFGAFAI